MSSFEYIDLYKKAQSNGKYHMFTFDIVDSKKMKSSTRWLSQQKMINLMLKIYNHIENIEIETNRKILMMEDGIVLYGDYDNMKNEFGLLMEPFVFGDTFGFTIYRDSLTYEEIINIYKYYKEELNIKFEFHIKDGYYDTNDWCRGNKLFFRGYCIDILSNYHKDKNPLKKMLTK